MLHIGPARGAKERAAAPSDIDDAMVRRFVAALLGPREEEIDGFISDLRRRGASNEEIYLDLMAPAARLLGKYWEDDDCNFLEITLALGRMQRVIRASTEDFRRERSAPNAIGRAMLCCLPGKDHSLGLIIVGEFLVRAGWSVSFGPPFAGDDGLVQLARRSYDVIGISVSCDFEVAALASFVRDVRSASCNPDLGVLIGGRVVNEAPWLVDRVGADATAMDARSAVRAAAAFVS